MTISKTTICLLHQNYQFLFGKVLPNSVLSIKKSHACALEYGHNICIFCKFILCYSHSHHFRKVTVYIVICGLINQFMHINQFTLWSQSMKCLSVLFEEKICSFSNVTSAVRMEKVCSTKRVTSEGRGEGCAR